MLTIFLIVLALIWLIFAVVSDLRTREIPNWLNFSLIIFALGARFFYDLSNLPEFSINSFYVILLLVLAPFLVFIQLSSSFKSLKKEIAFFASISLFFIIVIYFNYASLTFNRLILDSGFIYSYQGIFGLMAFFLLANILYFSRFFAGGDAKLMMALGPVIPLGIGFLGNVNLFLNFLFLLLIVRLAYDLICILYLGFRDSDKIHKEFYKNLKANKKFIYMFIIFGVLFIILGFFERLLFIPGILIFILPYLYFYTKAIENTSLIEKVGSKEITEGDWLYKDVKVGNRIIEANWNGLSKNEISLIRKKHKFVMIKRGIQFGPGFLIIFLIFIYLYFNGIDLWNSLWQP